MPSFENPYQLSEDENRAIFQSDIYPVFYEHLQSSPTPELHYFGGQPGAGKSTCERETIASLVQRDGLNSVAEISLDDFRDMHPAQIELLMDDEESAAEYTNDDCWLWSVQASQVAISRRSNVIREGTLRDAASVSSEVREYSSAGYRTELHVIAVPAQLSRLRYLSRYVFFVEQMGMGRLVSQTFHDNAYDHLPESLSQLFDDGVFDAYTIHDQEGVVLARVTRREPTEGKKKLMMLLAQGREANLDIDAMVRSSRDLMDRALKARKQSAATQLQILLWDIQPPEQDGLELRLSSMIQAERHSENAHRVAELSKQTMEAIWALYDLAETHHLNPQQYEEVQKIAQQAAQLLAQNLEHFVDSIQ